MERAPGHGETQHKGSSSILFVLVFLNEKGAIPRFHYLRIADVSFDGAPKSMIGKIKLTRQH